MTPELIFYLLLSFILLADMLCGDPRMIPHPVRFIGMLCSRFESLTRNSFQCISPRGQGVCTFCLVIGGSLLSGWVFIRLLGIVSIHAASVGAVLICYFCVAAGDLVKHSTAVRTCLDLGHVEEARKAVAMMVGRDTENLDEAEIARACIESVAENLVDGITAPLFWALVAALAAPVFGTSLIVSAAFGYIGYKAVNTMDSMFGYKNERYGEFGWFAARVDDVFNFIPARLSGVCVVVVSLLPGYSAGQALRVFTGDRLKSSSPNSAHTEAAVAGALGIRLGGQSSYFGEKNWKPYLGENYRDPGAPDIRRTNRLVLLSALLFYVLGFGLHLTLSALMS